MRQKTVLSVFLVAIGLLFMAVNSSAVSFSVEGAPRNLQRGSLLTVNILVADASELDGVVFSLLYPGNVLTLDTRRVTTKVFDTHKDNLGDDPGVGSYWSTGTQTLGTVHLIGLFKNASSSIGADPLTLFSVYFRVNRAAPTGIHSMRLFQSQLCNGPAGWGTDHNNNGVLDYLDNDASEFAPVLYSITTESGSGRDELDHVDTNVLMEGFDDPPLFVFNVLDGYAEVTPPDDDSNDDTTVNPVIDSDNDGIPDNEDECPNDPLKTEPGECGCGVPDVDTDNDGIFDCHDVLIRPANGAMDVSLSPVMEIEPFPDPGAAGPDAVIVWQISTDSAFTNLLFEYTGPYDVTEIQLPDLILDPYTTYYWRIRYGSGPWEATGVFTTGADPIRDDDGNGVPDDQDIVNANIQSNLIDAGDEGLILQSRANGLRYSLVAGEGVEDVERFRWHPVEDFEKAGFWPVNFNHGLLAFRLKTSAPGATVDVTIGFSEKMAAGSQWWKTRIDQDVYDFGQFTVFAEGLGHMTLTLTDGGAGDLDGVANGVIVDPGGIVEPETGNSGGGGGGGSSGCFVDACIPQMLLMTN